MELNKENTVYQSFEQFRSELFPQLVEQEIIEKMKQNPGTYGAYLANKAFDQMLATTTV